MSHVQHAAQWGPDTGAPPADTISQLRRIMSDAAAHDGFSPISDQAFIAAERGERELHRFDGDDEEAVAFAVIGGGELDVVVHPEARAEGVGSTVIAKLLGEAPVVGELRAWAHGENPAATTLLERSGFVPVRELLRMTLDPSLLPAPSEAPVSPAEYADGYHTAPFEPAISQQAEEWVRVNAAAFASHPEQGKMTLDDFTSLTREPWFDAEDLMLCYTKAGSTRAPKGHVAGYAWVKTVKDQHTASAEEPSGSHHRTECELYAIGVHPEHAGHGLGRALLGSVLARMAQHRPERVSLYVDGDNTRAVELYERQGFTVEQRSTQWLRR